METPSELFEATRNVKTTLGALRARMRELDAQHVRLQAFLAVLDEGVPSSAYRENAPPDSETLRQDFAQATKALGHLRQQESELMQHEHALHLALERKGMRRSLPVIGTINIASPCPADWAKMAGDERTRFCGMCKQNVFNLSEMTTEDASRLLAEKEGRLCVRFHQRADGTVMTSDCSEGLRRRERRNAVRGAMIAVAAAFGVWAVREQLQGDLLGHSVQSATQGGNFGGGFPPPRPPR